MFVRTNRFFILGVGEKRSLNQSSRVTWTIDAEFPLQAGIKCDLVDFAQKGRAKYIWVQAHAVSVHSSRTASRWRWRRAHFQRLSRR